MRREVNWENVQERVAFVRQLYPLVLTWRGQLPDLRDIFQPKEIDFILTQDLRNSGEKFTKRNPLYAFVIRTGYRDQPEVDENGEFSLRRSTALHAASKQPGAHEAAVARLFEIYDKFHMNYVDEETGVTHLHVACETGCYDVVEKFLDLGQDPNVLAPNSIGTPLHSACKNDAKNVARLLLERGADPNLADAANGLSPLHVICAWNYGDEMAELLFEMSDVIQHPVRVDALDKHGRTPLHLAARQHHRELVELLLKKGANPNAAAHTGFTPLHEICTKDSDGKMAMIFFDINDQLKQRVQIDARDKLGLTPLQLAVANLAPDVVDFLLGRGADLSSFVLPDEFVFDKCMKDRDRGKVEFRLRYTSGALAVVECLQKRGFRLDRRGALKIIQVIAKNRFLDKPRDKNWYNNQEFKTKAKGLIVKPNLSLYDLVWMLPEQAEKKLTYKDCVKLERSSKFWEMQERLRYSCAAYLGDVIVGGFFRKLMPWMPDFLLLLTRYRLPIVCCQTIINRLTNEEFLKLCLAIVFRLAKVQRFLFVGTKALLRYYIYHGRRSSSSQPCTTITTTSTSTTTAMHAGEEDL
ncbi:unnamed protein product [Trichogramma brassicae]|uniref:Uncharacterized protein n=1 Tax=Trichogramma brassicae TaxID=86971 RepID=A0A6H5IA92_9HYME|nr:unnamed protein product [Trichogramma brassicae]